MLVTLVPGITFSATAQEETTVVQSDTKENTNQAGGIIYTKTSTANSDGTIDITLTAHTTGVVRQMSSVEPTDIVLVLDASGSMDDNYTTTRITGYNEATGSEYTYTTGWWFWEEEHTAYGLENTSSTYYINTGTEQEPVYTRVSYTGRDTNGFEMYEYSVGNSEVIIYPVLSGDISTDRQYSSYSVVQFYSATVDSQTIKKMKSLQDAVKTFIDATAQMNQGLEVDQMHTISIVKFANENYYNSTVPTVTEGNNRGYSQVVKNLTPVDSDGTAELKAAVDAISPNGATAVDYGLNLAQAVLMNRSAVNDEGAVDRKEVVIVFSDGSPTYNNGFQDSVANNAITVAGNMKSAADVTIYSVCIDTNADATDIDENINKFMHYVSSNYPNAKNMTTPGENGSINNGYYLTPDSTTSLLMIFESIIQEIDHPTITMGEEATMVDTISPYFDFENGNATEITLRTRAKTQNGWSEELEEDENLDYEISESGDRLTVNGFNFDENFISETGRGENNDFYGKQLVVSFKVIPDYDVIDAASVTLGDGILPTNSGFASLVNSEEIPAAEVTTPELETRQITYIVDENEYKTYKRFTGSDFTIDAEPTKEGYEFSGWTIDGEDVKPGDEFEMPNEDVEIIGVFTVNKYPVEYVYSGTTPADATDLSGTEYNGNPANAEVPYGSTVTIAPDATAENYTFSGWKPDNQSVVVTNGEFKMPDSPVRLIGSFTPITSSYKVIHKTETMEDGVYETRETDDKTAFAGSKAVALPKYYHGFTYDETAANVTEGTVTTENDLELILYYDRNEYEVTYDFTGDVPTKPDYSEEIDPPATKKHKFEEVVTVAENADEEGYKFLGWESLSTDATALETFSMPDNDVAFIGEFTANVDTSYSVEYYLETLTDNEFVLADNTVNYSNTGTTGTTVYANEKEFEGFYFDESNEYNVLSGKIAGNGSLVLKRYYKRNSYKLTYAYENPTQPGGAPDISNWEPETYKFGEEVEVKDDLTLDHFNFAGWHSTGYTVGNDTESFTMPARDVTLYGNFERIEGVAWVEKHYFQKLDGTYSYSEDPESDAPDYTFNHTGTAGDNAIAEPIKEIVGFELDTGHEKYSATSEINENGKTELRFFYKRKEYKVIYRYEPAEQPENAPDLSQLTRENVRYGTEDIDVAEKPELDGYSFDGWYPQTSGIPSSGTFEMPAHDVVFEGNFNPRSDTKYEVHHYLQNADGTYPDSTENINYHTGITGEKITAAKRNFPGYTFDYANPEEGIVDVNNLLVLKLYYKRTEYNVTYFVDGFVPDGVTAPQDAESPYRHGEKVELLDVLDAPEGYVFVGWTSVAQESDEDVVTIVGNEFTMPMHNVRLRGTFDAKTNTPYIIRHMTQKKDLNGYEIYSEAKRTGTTDEDITVYALTIPGFKNVTTVGEVVVSSKTEEILPDGSLVIEFFYDRNPHKITYEYEGTTPAGADEQLPEQENNVHYGKEVTVADAPSVPGYTFDGWNTSDAEIVDGEFTMPDKDVVLKGKFSSNLVDYTVNYWLQNVDAGDAFDENDYTLDSDSSYTKEALVGQHVEAETVPYTGFHVNSQESNSYGHVTVDPDTEEGNLVLNIYYDRNVYNVEYIYYGEQPENAPDLSELTIENVRYGTENIEVKEKLELEGYFFDGWYTRTANVVNNKFTMPNHDVSFLGRFIAQYAVSYDLNGGTGAEGVDYSTITVPAGAEITVKAKPTRSGYTFNGWKEGENTFNPDDTVTVDRNINFVAQWTRNGGGGGGGITTRYTLTYETNGGNKIAMEAYTSGTTVKLTKVPVKDGYVFDGWHLDESLTEDVDEVKMNKNITVYAAWVEDNGGAGSGHDTPDALDGEHHFAYIIGYPDDTVRPLEHITRAEVTAILFRLLKEDVRNENLASENPYDDIEEDAWYRTSVSTLTKMGIVFGRTETEFMPNEYITRAEFASFCARFDDSEFEVVDNFTDVEGHWAEAEIHEAAAHGWIRGYEDKTFRPDQFITRAEAMTMINRVLNRVPETIDDLHDDMIKWSDNSDESAWYYIAVQEATNSHEFEMKNNIYEKWINLSEVTDWTKYEP